MIKKILLLLIFVLFPVSAQAEGLSERLRGYILLQVESKGEAWYVNPADSKRYYMRDGNVAYTLMREKGIGVTNVDLLKIPVGVKDTFGSYDADMDSDSLPNKTEEALGTNPNNSDSDGDSYSDGQEILNGYDPLGPGRLNYDVSLTNRLKGHILLQVESKGEAWYVNPADGKRYYMKDGEVAYQIMRYLSLGIKNSDLAQISISDIKVQQVESGVEKEVVNNDVISTEEDKIHEAFNFISPVSGATFKGGEEITIELNIPDTFESVLIYLTGDTVEDGRNVYQKKYTFPVDEKTGKHIISAIGFTKDGFFETNVTINLEPSSPVVSIKEYGFSTGGYLVNVNDPYRMSIRATLESGEEISITDDPKLTYKSLSPSIFSVDSKGNVTGHQEGEGFIFAQYDNSSTAYAYIQIIVKDLLK